MAQPLKELSNRHLQIQQWEENAKTDSEAGFRKQAKLVDNILEHTSRHDKSTKARLLAKIIDRNGSVFGKEIKMKSKAIQQTLKLTPEQTASLMADNGSDYRLKKFNQ